MNTTLIKWDGTRVLYPNYKMNTDMITNITRSNNKGETFSVNVDLGTSLEVFAQVEASLRPYVEASPDINAFAVSPGNGGNPLKFTLTVWFEYTFNSESSFVDLLQLCGLSSPSSVTPALRFCKCFSAVRYNATTCLTQCHASNMFLTHPFNTKLAFVPCILGTALIFRFLSFGFLSFSFLSFSFSSFYHRHLLSLLIMITMTVIAIIRPATVIVKLLNVLLQALRLTGVYEFNSISFAVNTCL